MGNTQSGGTAAASSWQARSQDSSSSKRGGKSWATPVSDSYCHHCS
jgi:hypothetical protein